MNFNGASVLIATQRGWQAASGLVTSILVVNFLSPEAQGWYYSLLSVAGLFTLFELGLSQIITQRAAAASSGQMREWKMRSLVTLVSYANTRFSRAALIFFALVFPLGVMFFVGTFAEATVSKGVGFDLVIWLVLVAATAINLWFLGFQSLLEGAGEIGRVYASRLTQGVVGSSVAWLVLSAGGGLWAVVCVPVAGVITSALWFLPQIKQMGRWLGLRAKNKEQIAAMNAQRRRLGITWVSGYFLTQLYVPLLLKTEGATVAGQFGLSLAIANMLALVSQSWLTQAYPQMAERAARRDWRSVRGAFRRALTWSCAGYVLGALLLISLLGFAVETPYPQRMLSLSNLSILLLAIFINQTCGALALHLRSAGLEPLAWVNVGSAVLTLLGAWLMLDPYGVRGLLAVMLGVQALFALPCTLWVWSAHEKGLP
jgi:O-antigen/teichoic acid export membrane protein